MAAVDKQTQTCQEDFLNDFGFSHLRTVQNEIDLMNYEVMLKQCRLCLDDNPYFSSELRKEPTAEDVRSSFAFLANNLDFAAQSWCEKCKQKLGTLLYGLIHLSNTEKIFLRLQKSAKEYHEAEARRKVQQEMEKQQNMKVLRSESVLNAFRKLQQKTADISETIQCGESDGKDMCEVEPKRKRIYKGKDIKKLMEEEEKRYKGCVDTEYTEIWESNLICNDKQRDVCGIVLRRSTRSKSVSMSKKQHLPPATRSRRKSMFVSKVVRDIPPNRRKSEEGVCDSTQTTVEKRRRQQTKNICICCEHTPLQQKKSNTKPRKKVARNNNTNLLTRSHSKDTLNSQRVNEENTFHIDGIDFYEYYPTEDEWDPEEDLDVIWTIGYSSATTSAASATNKLKRRYKSSTEEDHKSPNEGEY